MVEHFIQFVGSLGHWGYLIIFMAVALESGAFLGFVIPGEFMVLLGGFLAAQGTLDVGDLMIWVCVGAVLGDTIGYEIGRRLGRERLLRMRWFARWSGHLKRVEEFFHRHGGKAVFLGRFTAVLRALTPFVAGSSGMPYFRFLLYNAAGGVVWGVCFVLIGYLAGASWRLVGRWAGAAAAIVVGLVVLVFALAWLWRWVARHEQEIRRLWNAFLAWPRVAAFRRRYSGEIAFLQARLTPSGYLGLHLTIGVIIIAIAAWLFGAIAEDIFTHDPLTVVDVRVDAWLHARAAPQSPLTAFFFGVTALGSPRVIAAVSLLTALVLALRRRWFWLLQLVLAVPGGILVNMVVKYLFHRSRPAFAHPLVHLLSYSFPSAHTLAAVVLYGLLAFFAVQVLPGWRWRSLAVIAACFLIVLIGFSRMYLGAHYLSDVLGAMTEGVAWLAICVTGVETLRRYLPQRQRASG